MKLATNRKLSPKSITKINKDLVDLFEHSTFSDNVTRLSVEIRAVELMKERQRLKSKLEAITGEPVEWKESDLTINPKLALTSKGQFIRKAQKELASWKNQLKRLQHKARVHRVHFGKGFNPKIAMLKTRKDYLHLKLNELKKTSSEQWLHLKNQFELRMKEYKTAYQDTLQELQH